MKVKLKELLSKAEDKSVAKCVDIWTSKRKREYLDVTVHFLDELNAAALSSGLPPLYWLSYGRKNPVANDRSN